MKFYLLRNIPDDLWVRVRQRAAGEGRSLRFVMLRLLERYALRRVHLDEAASDNPGQKRRE